MKRKVTQIQFLDHQINLEFNGTQQFQFCERCSEQGAHLQTFLAAYVPGVNLSKLSTRSLVFLERQLFYSLTHHSPRRAVGYELHSFMEKFYKRLNGLVQST